MWYLPSLVSFTVKILMTKHNCKILISTNKNIKRELLYMSSEKEEKIFNKFLIFHFTNEDSGVRCWSESLEVQWDRESTHLSSSSEVPQTVSPPKPSHTALELSVPPSYFLCTSLSSSWLSLVSTFTSC